MAYSFGVFKRKNHKMLSFDIGLKIGIRGYAIKANTNLTTSIATRVSKTEGHYSMTYLDIPLSFTLNINKKWSTYIGTMSSFILKTSYLYDTKSTTTIISTGAVSSTTQHFSSGSLNEAIDNIDFASYLGIRFRWNSLIASSLYGIIDLTGRNRGVINFKADQTTRGLYLSFELNVLNSFKKVRYKCLSSF